MPAPWPKRGGTAATVALTFATTATAAFTVRLRLCGEVIDVGVASGDTVTAIATAVADAINDNPRSHTAQNSSGVVTIEAKHDGPRGNTLIVDAYFVSSTGAEVRITASSTSGGAGTTGIWSSNGTIGSEITLANGPRRTTSPTRSRPSSRSATTIVGACIDATNTGRIVTHVNAQAGPTVQLLEQPLVGSTDTYANVVAFATGRNASRLQVVWNHATVIPAGRSPRRCAPRASLVTPPPGGSRVGEASDPPRTSTAWSSSRCSWRAWWGPAHSDRDRERAQQRRHARRRVGLATGLRRHRAIHHVAVAAQWHAELRRARYVQRDGAGLHRGHAALRPRGDLRRVQARPTPTARRPRRA